jgi:hypothetical protein
MVVNFGRNIQYPTTVNHTEVVDFINRINHLERKAKIGFCNN